GETKYGTSDNLSYGNNGVQSGESMERVYDLSSCGYGSIAHRYERQGSTSVERASRLPEQASARRPRARQHGGTGSQIRLPGREEPGAGRLGWQYRLEIRPIRMDRGPRLRGAIHGKAAS